MPTRLFGVLAPAVLLAAAAPAQDFLLSYSQFEFTLSGSAGTVLQFLYPNEIAHLEWSTGPCASLSAEKWSPRTCFHTMAGDENGNAMYWNPWIFGSVDALMVGVSGTPLAMQANPRTVFWSPSVAMGTGVSGPPGLRPGDVGRIIRNSANQDGQVEYFMSQDQFNLALGLPLNNPLDIDAIAFHPGLGVYFSLDQDTWAFTSCGPVFIQDGAIIAVPDFALTYTPDFRIASVLPGSAEVVYTEAQMDAFTWSAQVTDRFGNCVPVVIDLEALEIDPSGTGNTIVPCPGTALFVPDFIYSAETLTGAGLCTTAGGGQIYSGICGAAARGCGGGPTFGPQMGIQPTSTTIGAPSYVNSLALAVTTRYSMEPQQHVVNAFPLGLPQGSQTVAISSPFAWNFVLWTPAPSGPNVVAQSAWNPFGLLCFPDFYPSPTFYWATPTVGGFATWPMIAIPPNFTGKIVFQSIALPSSGAIELSTPITFDIQ